MPLAADMTRIVAAGRARLVQAQRDVLAAVSADLVQNTPVKKGFLRAAWTPAAVASIPNAPDPAGTDATARLVAAAQALPLGGTFTVTNGMFYARLVEYGTIRMAPRAYMRGTIARAPAIAVGVLTRGGPRAQP